MKAKRLPMAGLLLGLMLSAAPTLAADEPIYGSQLMTAQERTDYRNKMRAAKTPEAQEKLRQEHHDAMVARAKAQGKTLPAEPPPRGSGPGPGMGPGGGMGPGSGMGPGRRGN